ncbi:MAG: glycosyltransferase, partial [Kiritimatiellae bacterium]|nr:glycosyltransferase [Kiritimatiellia bacterium]
HLGVEHLMLPLDRKNPFVLRAVARSLAAYCAEEGVTLMHVRSRAPAWAVKWASARCGVPWLATFHGVYGTSPRLLKLPYNRVMLQGERTIAVSAYVRRHILETYAGVSPDHVVLIHRGADTNVFRPDAVPREVAEAKKTVQLGFEPDRPVVTLPGRLTRWKGQEVFLEALGLMRNRRFGVLVLGSDQGRTDYSDHLRTMAGRLSDETRVVFKAHTSEMPVVYALSDIVVNASSGQPEAFGRTIPEAQASGCLVLATAHGGACETVKDGETGFLVPPGDARAMAARLDAMLEMSEEAKSRMRAAARASVCADFSTDLMCAKTLALYDELHARGRGGRM